MPFPQINVPKGTSDEVLAALRKEVVRVLSEKMGCSPQGVIPIFVRSILPDAESVVEGGTTISALLFTAMFHGKDEDPKPILAALGTVVWKAFQGK